jgi:hypothetical protein
VIHRLLYSSSFLRIFALPLFRSLLPLPHHFFYYSTQLLSYCEMTIRPLPIYCVDYCKIFAVFSGWWILNLVSLIRRLLFLFHFIFSKVVLVVMSRKASEKRFLLFTSGFPSSLTKKPFRFLLSSAARLLNPAISLSVLGSFVSRPLAPSDPFLLLFLSSLAHLLLPLFLSAYHPIAHISWLIGSFSPSTLFTSLVI